MARDADLAYGPRGVPRGAGGSKERDVGRDWPSRAARAWSSSSRTRFQPHIATKGGPSREE